MSERRVRQRARRENWPMLQVAGRGGKSGEVISSLLPADVRQELALKETEGQGLAIIRETTAPGSVPAATPDRAKEIGLAKYQLVHAFRKALKAAPWGGRADAAAGFVVAYNSQRLLPNVYNVIGDVAEKTLRALDNKLKKADDNYTALCDGRGGWKKHGTTKYKQSSLSTEAQQALLQCYVQPQRPSVLLAIKGARLILEKAGHPADYSDSTFRRYLREYEARCAHVVCLGREGMKAYQDKFAPYISRDSSLLEVGQCLVADGKVLNFTVLHPQTGRPVRMMLILFFDWASRMPMGWQLMPTENTLAIAAAFRNSVVTLGRYPDSVYLDNGRAFKSKVFMGDVDLEETQGIYARVGTAVHFAKPYNGRSKVVERFFETFQSQCECLIPSFCGDSIATKPAHMHRNETFHQAWHEAKTKNWVPNIREAAYLIDRYIQWYADQPHLSLGNRTPRELFEPQRGTGVDPAQLREDFLWRKQVTPNRCRVTVMGVEYTSEVLHGLSRSNKIEVRYDIADMRQVYCYTGGHYLGEAEPVMAIHPLAKMFGDEVSAYELQTELKNHARIRKTAKKALMQLGVKGSTALDILPYNEKVAIDMEPAQIEAGVTPEQIEAPEDIAAELAELEAMQDEPGVTLEPESPEMDAVVAEPVNPMDEMDTELKRLNQADRYERLLELEAQGVEIGTTYQTFMKYFEEGSEYRNQKDYFEQRRLDLAIVYGQRA